MRLPSKTALPLRYAPFLGIAAVQLLLVAIAPSIGRSDATPEALAPLPLASQQAGSAPSGSAPGVVGPSGSVAGTGGARTTTGGQPRQAGGPAGSSVPGAAAGPADFSRCAPGHALQQRVTSQSVPCLPAFRGNNGGATYRGVTAKTITIVVYQPKVNAVVNSVIASGGFGEDPAAQRDVISAFSVFFAKHYELAGRTIEWKTFAGNCTVDPPDNDCLRGEARTIASTLKPFWVLWPTGRPSFYDELSRLGVLNSGGLTFGGAFNRAQRPYHWSSFMDGDRVANSIADYWCKKLVGKPASLAGDPTLTTAKRKLGILVRQEPANKLAADLLSSLVSGGRCGTSADKPTIVTYSQDIATAQQQSANGVAILRNAGVTTVVSLGSVLEIALQTQGFTRNEYFPENLMSGAGLTDIDAAARIIDKQQWAHAFGPSNEVNARPRTQDDDTRAWLDAGRTGVPYGQAGITFAEMQQVVWQIQETGAHLTPLEVERASLSMPVIGGWDATRGNPFAKRYAFSSSGYTGPSDSRQVYWSNTATSAADGKQGAYIPVDGGHRYPIGSWPAGEPEK